MELIHLTPNDYITSQWSGGSTTQIAIAPQGAIYAERDFIWRVSSASVDLDESDFTPLADYERYISTLKGNMILTHNDGHELLLNPFEVHSFDGGDHTHSRGRCTDFNLMIRKGSACGKLTAYHPSEGNAISVEFEADKITDALWYCAEGSIEILENEVTIANISAGESALLHNCAKHRFVVRACRNSKIMLAEINY